MAALRLAGILSDFRAEEAWPTTDVTVALIRDDVLGGMGVPGRAAHHLLGDEAWPVVRATFERGGRVRRRA